MMFYVSITIQNLNFVRIGNKHLSWYFSILKFLFIFLVGRVGVVPCLVATSAEVASGSTRFKCNEVTFF